MKIEVFRGQDNQGFHYEALPVINEVHNIRYSYAERNCLYFQALRFPYKELLMKAAEFEEERVNMKFQRSYVRACIKKDETVLSFVFRYKVEKVERKRAGELCRRSIVDKEMVLNMTADKEEIVQLVDPELEELENVNKDRAATYYIRAYNRWAHPPKLEEVIAKLTEEQKDQAAEALRKMFNVRF